MNSELTPEKLTDHIGHAVAVVTYGDVNVSLECEDCCVVLADADLVGVSA